MVNIIGHIQNALAAISDELIETPPLPQKPLEKVTCQTGMGHWLYLRFRNDGQQPRLWAGWATATVFDGIVNKPRLLMETEWRNSDGVEWQLLVVESAPGDVIGSASFDRLPRAGTLSETWWSTTGTSIKAIGALTTDRVAVSTELLERRIGRYLEVSKLRFITSHGDLHWGNLTSNSQIIDWDSWGVYPVGFDWATLWAFSLPNPRLAEEVLDHARQAVSGRELKAAQLFILEEIYVASAHNTRYRGLAHHANQFREHGYGQILNGPC